MAEPDRQPKKTLRKLWEARGWSQETLAAQIRVNRSMIWRWGRGERVPRARTQQRLAILFGVSVEVSPLAPTSI